MPDTNTPLNILSPGAKLPRWALAVVVLMLGFVGWFYVSRAVEHGYMVNRNLQQMMDTEVKERFKGSEEAAIKANRPVNSYDLNDQRVYMNYGKGLRESNYEMFITRMRMPMFMYLLSTVTDSTPRPQDSESLKAFYNEYFPVARAFNIGLSIALLVAMFFALHRWLGNWMGLSFCLIVAFQLFILKSPYVQPEVLIAALVVVTVGWIVRTLHEPTWVNAMIAGFCLCAWHMTKANALVALAATGLIMGFQLLFASTNKRRLAILIAGPVMVAAYFLPISPYLYTSYKIFGSPLHNVQSKYYMWATDVDDKHDLQGMGLDRTLASVDKDGDGKVDKPEDLPSASKYWREHSWESIKDRIERGVVMMYRNAFVEYPPFFAMLLLWSGLALIAMATCWEKASLGILKWKWELAYVAILLTAFTYLFGWFTTLKVGPRLVNSISLIPLLFFMAIVHHLWKDKAVRLAGRVFSSEKLLIVAFLITWVAFTALHLQDDLIGGYFAG
ncbi:MAG: hypothetical protein ACAI34_08695 [Verrucomicrobium sp.]